MRTIAYLVLALAAGAVYACSTDKSTSPATEVGTKSGSVNLALVSTTSDGRTFRLDNASFRVTPTIDSGTPQTISAPGEATALQFDLPVGTYTVQLLSGWQLSEVLPNGVVQKVDASVSGPVQLVVTADATTDAVFHFQLVDSTGAVGTGRITFDVATSTCVPRVIADCRAAGRDCGPMDDGCSGTVDCGTCPTGATCSSAGECVCPANPSCASLGAQCGIVTDVCGTPHDCGNCNDGSSCNPNTHQCECVPQTCGTRVCGVIPNGCGGALDCGNCPTGTLCNSAGQCDPVCVPLTQCTVACGTQSDGCGGTLTCPTCPSGQTCVEGACTPAACVGNTCSQLGFQCGSHVDNCGNAIDCGTCPSGNSCNPQGQCVPACVAQTCSQLGFQCGTHTDNCGSPIDCGGCPTGNSCTVGGQCLPNCQPRTCAQLGFQCGIQVDNCGSPIDCGGCPTGTTCNAQGQCLCQPTTCQALGFDCGEGVSDGCGGTLPSCGTCGSGRICTGNKCVAAPQVTISFALTSGSPWNAGGAGGYCVNFTITNQGTQTTKNWTAVVDLKGATIGQSWNAARTTTPAGAQFVSYDYNAKIAPSGTVQFGYCADFKAGYVAPVPTVTATY